MGVVKEVRRFDVHLVDLDPTRGGEIRKTRPCVVVSPDEMNRHIHTAIGRPDDDGEARLPDPGRRHVSAKARLVRRLGRLPERRGREITSTLQTMFAFD